MGHIIPNKFLKQFSHLVTCDRDVVHDNKIYENWLTWYIGIIVEKKNKVPIACLTAYSKNTAVIADKYCDIILVGDSVGMVLYGMKNTRDVKIETMILHGRIFKAETTMS